MSFAKFKKIKYLVIAAVFFCWLLLAIAGFIFYEGTLLIYVLFTLVFFILVLDSIYKPCSLGYSFLAIFLWLGFWAKLVVHLCLGYSYREPTGYFLADKNSWDTVLLVSTIGVISVILTKSLLLKYTQISTWSRMTVSRSLVPYWYPRLRPWLWLTAISMIVLLPFFNIMYGVFQIGIAPKILAWPLNALISWLLGFGLVVMLGTLVCWDHALRRGWAMGFVGVLLEGFLTGFSILSRSVYLFHTMPYIIILFVKRFANSLHKKITLGVISVWLILFIISLTSVMVLRYSAVSFVSGGASSNQELIDSNKPFEFSSFANKLTAKLSLLVVDRWIGLEGVMAVSSFPDKSPELFFQALKEQRSVGSMDIYTKTIAKVDLTDSELEKFQYASIPGAIAFFYYAGSFYSVFFGMALLVLLMLLSERVVLLLTHNPYILAFWSMGIAQTVVSFGLGTAQMLSYFLVCFGSFGIVWLVQRKGRYGDPYSKADVKNE